MSLAERHGWLGKEIGHAIDPVWHRQQRKGLGPRRRAAGPLHLRRGGSGPATGRGISTSAEFTGTGPATESGNFASLFRSSFILASVIANASRKTPYKTSVACRYRAVRLQNLD